MCYFIQNINWELVIALIAIIVSIYTLWVQRKHNKLSYKPLPVLVKYNYTDVIKVRLWNEGTGPLIIENLIASRNSTINENIIDMMPQVNQNIKYVEFIREFKNRVIGYGKYLTLLEFKIRDESYVEPFREIRKELDGITIKLSYKDIYNQKFYYEEKLSFERPMDEEPDDLV